MASMKRAAAATAIIAALTAGTSTAYAAAMGTAYLSIEDLLFTDTSDGSVITLGTDIAPAGSGLRNNGDTLATLNGTSTTQTGDEAAQPSGFDVDGAGFSCIGGGCTYVDDSFTHLVAGDDQGTYVVSDVNLQGSAVDLGPGTSGANAQALAESAVAPVNIGSSQSNVGLSATFDFIWLQGTTDLGIDFDFDAYLRAALLGVPGVSADASIGWSISIDDLTDGDLFEYDLSSDDEWVRSGISTGLPETDRVADFNGSVSIATTGGFLEAGHRYQLTIDHFAEANSEAIPVPAPLALLGTGLVLFGWMRARRNNA